MNRNLVKHIIFFITLALLTVAGEAWAQNDSPFVIKKGGNYLAHVKVGENYVLQNADSFNPSTCLWYSGPTYNPTGYTHNYYFEDDAHNLRFLAAPLQPDATLSLSSSLPSVSMLRNTDQVYYFYNWDPETELNGVPEGGGVAKGHRYYVDTQELCQACGDYAGASWYVPESGGTPQCWEVYWIENEESNWKLSSTSSYTITSKAARYRKVTVTEHEKEITDGGLTTLTVPSEMNYEDQSTLLAPVGSPYSYIPAYTHYAFLENGSESIHNYWGSSDYGDVIPTQVNEVEIGNRSYQWTISGDGASFLSFNSGSDVNTSTAESPTLFYREQNISGHKEATITVTVTYTDESNNQTTQTLSATMLVKTPCHNPLQDATPVVTYSGVTVSWLPTAETYTVFWKKDDASVTTWSSAEVGNVTSYPITGLEFDTEYKYKVQATSCSPSTSDPTDVYSFHTLEEPGLVVVGAIFGGGRMANVGGNTEVVIVNCDSIGNIFGGNDIAGEVQGANGSTIILGVDDGAYASYGTTPSDGKIRVTSVYGGGNGYYAYNGTSFVAATEDYTSEAVAAGASVKAMTQSHTVGEVVWTNDGTASKTLDFPSIVKTAITVTNDKVKVDSVFGGAKNAFLTYNGTNADPDGSLITIEGGTIMAVFGGNNFGGTQGYGQHHLVVNKTTTCLTANNGQPQAGTSGHLFGRDFGIGYLFGGGNKVYGSTTNIEIFGGQTDNVFGGGNSADVYAANVKVNCSLGAYSSEHPYTYGNTYTSAIPTSYQSGAISIKDDYPWNGKEVYNVRNLYGGNNMEHMASVPTVTLTSGSVGTVYGGGNAGDMLASTAGSIDEDDDSSTPGVSFNYSTKVILNSANIIVDYLYGGCRMSNVDYSTWVQIQNGHVGTVFGGCNVSGDVGSTRVNPSATSGTDYQEVQGGTYVEASGGIVYKNLFAGGNGFYHCNQNFHYVSGINYTDENFVGRLVPSHNETYANVRTGATIKGNVYAGGNLAPVGFQDQVAPYFPSFPTNAVGWAVVHIYGGTIEGNVFGGGNMADVYGSNDVLVAGGTIAAVYGGNDRTGQVAEYSNRVLPAAYAYATDGYTSLLQPEVHAYVRVVGNPTIQEVYGGGNGDYDYENGDEVVPEYCDENESGPIQSNTFVDININGGAAGGHIGTVYGGGDGVTASGFITVFININEPNPAEDYVNVNTVFGGNNKGPLDLVPNIILLHGQVGTVYGGCNEGAMTAATGVDVGDYQNIGSYVRLRNSYDPDGEGSAPAVTPTIKVTEAVYGGCRMNGVTRNSLVLVEGHDFSTMTKGIFGGSDISGTVSGFSRVAVTGGTAIVGNVYGGGNGGYYYKEVANTNTTGTHFEVYTDDTETELVADSVVSAPICAQSGADILGGNVGTAALLGAGTVSRVFGAGYGKDTQTTGNVIVNVGNVDAASATATPTIYGEIYGGSAFGNVNTAETSSNHYTTTVNFLNGTLKKATVNEVDYGGNLYGGGLGRQAVAAVTDPETGEVITPGVEGIAALVKGEVFVTIGDENQTDENCFIDLRQANIFGCNNENGSPQDNVRVDVWRTAYDFTDDDYDYSSQEGVHPYYAIDQVFGGGNHADYAPENGSSSSEKKTWVYVHNCLNTIRRVFAGGNAAAATGVKTTIEGGRFDYVFGGGNGEVSAANIGAGGTNLLVSGGIINHLFGGSNHEGDIEGEMRTEVTGSTNGCTENITEFFAGSNEAELSTTSGVNAVISCGAGTIAEVYGGSNKALITGNVKLDVKGGTITNVFGGSKGVQGGTAANIDGNVTLNLLGGAITDAFGGSNQNGNITGNILVNVVDYGGDCGLDLTNVYGGGNVTPYDPDDDNGSVVNVIHIAQTDGIKGNVFGGAKGSTAIVTANPIVNIGYDATSMASYVTGITIPASPRAYVKGNVFGGGDAAPVSGNTTVNVFKGEIVHKLVGGGNNITTSPENPAGVSGNVVMRITGGNICTVSNPTLEGEGAGIYGGCNTSGNVGGNITVNIDGSSTTPTNIGTLAALQAVAAASGNPISVHGGGYGFGTSTNGNVTVNFGSADASTTENNTNLTLWGDLYGGSALGTVNDDANDKTTVTLLNGIVKYQLQGNTQYGGTIYGGGLGNNDHAAHVYGEVHVNIGDTLDSSAPSDRIGKASLIGCNVFGCNNKNGSPQRNVYVHVFQTNHTESDLVTNENGDFAINAVYGGGNRADYAPTTNYDESYALKTHNHIHACDNTIGTVYGGGRAASADGVVTKVDGGRFEYIFGGGNGQLIPADIGWGGIDLTVCSGHVGYKYVGCDMGGNVLGQQLDHECTDGPCTGSLVVDYFFFGANKATIIGGLIDTIPCDPINPMEYKNVYAGSRLATIYGDIYMVVRGGKITNLFGGSQGSVDRPGHVRKFPHLNNPEEMALVPDDAYNDMLIYLEQNDGVQGTGGNIYLKLEGGDITNVFGGNQLYGNVDGDIIVVVDTIHNNCPLSIDTLYGGNEKAIYNPDLKDGKPRLSPQVYIKDGKVNYDVFGGSLGDRRSEIVDAGKVYSHPYVLVGSDQTADTAVVGRNLYGGGSMADVEDSTKVVLRGKVTIDVIHEGDKEYGGNVYGGSRLGYVGGNTKVEIEPSGTIEPIVIPPHPTPELRTLHYSINVVGGGEIEVTDGHGTVIHDGDQVAERSVLHIRAIPNTNAGYSFYCWGASGGSVASPYLANTALIVGSGTSDVSLVGNFVSSAMSHHTLTLTADPAAGGSFKVNDAANSGSASIPNGLPVKVQAVPDEGYAFNGWTVTSGSATIENPSLSTITFTMTGDVSLKANFVPLHNLTLVVEPDSACTITVNYDPYTDPVPIAEGASPDIEATPADGYESWTVSWTVTNGDGTVTNSTSLSPTFTMGTGDATLKVTFTNPNTP